MHFPLSPIIFPGFDRTKLWTASGAAPETQILVDPIFSKVPIARPATVRIIDDAAPFLASGVQEAKSSRARTATRAFLL